MSFLQAVRRQHGSSSCISVPLINNVSGAQRLFLNDNNLCAFDDSSFWSLTLDSSVITGLFGDMGISVEEGDAMASYGEFFGMAIKNGCVLAETDDQAASTLHLSFNISGTILEGSLKLPRVQRLEPALWSFLVGLTASIGARTEARPHEGAALEQIESVRATHPEDDAMPKPEKRKKAGGISLNPRKR